MKGSRMPLAETILRRMRVHPGIAVFLVLIFGLILSSTPVRADGIGTSSASFLRGHAGPRSIALGGASTALANDGFALFENPAGLSNLPGTTFSMTQTEVFNLIDRGVVGMGIPYGKNHTFGLGGRYLKATDTVRTERKTLNSFDNQKTSGGLYYAYGGRQGLSLGLGAKLVRQTLYEYSTSDYALDGGLHYRRGSFSLGATVQNYGPDVQLVEGGPADPLPQTYSFGLAQRFDLFFLDTTLSFEGTQFVPEAENFASMGLELRPFQPISFRFGVRNPLNVPEQDLGVRAGLGFQLYGLSVDYSFVSEELLDDRHRFSVTLLFGGRSS